MISLHLRKITENKLLSNGANMPSENKHSRGIKSENKENRKIEN